eukprot:4086479-Pleurochrysis_carterae.AAC.1
MHESLPDIITDVVESFPCESFQYNTMVKGDRLGVMRLSFYDLIRAAGHAARAREACIVLHKRQAVAAASAHIAASLLVFSSFVL